MSTKHKEKAENNIECTAKATITDLKQDVRANTRNITIYIKIHCSIRISCQIYQIDLMTLKVLHLFL